MIYIACVLSGLLAGFLIKDYAFKQNVLDLNADAKTALRFARAFVSQQMPLSPEEFLNTKAPGDTGVGLIDDRMILVVSTVNGLHTLNDISVKEILGNKYDDLEIVPYIPDGKYVAFVLKYINKLFL